MKSMEHNRLVTFDGTVNFRDIGGYENDEGKHVKWNKIYRSDSLSSLTKSDEEKLEKVNLAEHRTGALPQIIFHLSFVKASSRHVCSFRNKSASCSAVRSGCCCTAL